MTLEELKVIESNAYDEVKRIEQDILEPVKRRWRNAYQAVAKAEEEAKIDAEVRRRMAQQTNNQKGN